MSEKRWTQKPLTVTLEKDRKIQLDQLIGAWSMKEKKLVLQALENYSPSPLRPTRSRRRKIRELFTGKDWEETQEFTHLSNPDIFTSIAERYRITGERDKNQAFQKIFDMEISGDDRKYLNYFLKKQTHESHVPQEITDIVISGTRRHLLGILTEDDAPKVGMYLISGPTGIGKSDTFRAAINKIFDTGIKIEQKFDDELEKAHKEHPIMARLDLDYVNADLAERLREDKRKKKLKLFSRIPGIKHLHKEETADVLDEDDQDFGTAIRFVEVHSRNVQSMWYGQTGNEIAKFFGDKNQPTIVMIDEAHAILKPHKSINAQVQEDVLIATFNEHMDEIQRGERNCIVFALSRMGDEIYEDVYRRFHEKGMIIDMRDPWKKTTNLEALVNIEARQQDIDLPNDDDRKTIVNKIKKIFEYRDLAMTPAYVRKLVENIAQEKGDLKPEYFDDGVLVRRSFVNVARNVYQQMFEKVYNTMPRNVAWEDYVGDIKDDFQEIANNSLKYDLRIENGVILTGPTGSGKTFLAQVYASRNKDITVINLSMEDLYDEKDPINGPPKRIAQVYDIAKMCAPSMVFIDEGETAAAERKGDWQDKVTNKLLNEIGGEKEMRGVFTVLTTNKHEHIAEAMMRSKRLMLMTVSGQLHERDIYRMIDNYFGDEPLSPDLTKEQIYTVSRKICYTPADYSALFEEILNVRKKEQTMIRIAADTPESILEDFIVDNYKALLGVAESLGLPKNFLNGSKKDIAFLKENREVLMTKLKEEAYNPSPTITLAHLTRAREARAKAPKISQKLSLDEHLASKLSEEPQLGVVTAIGANETMGMLLPLKSSKIYGADYMNEKIFVTGAVKGDGPSAQLNPQVEMMTQSAKEAYAMVFNYLGSLIPEKDVNRIIGTYLNNYHFQHQFLTVSYFGGGGSAGMALAINTLSVILELPVRNDFGITGAVWSGGTTKDNIGSATLIGGANQKTQIVLSYLPRTYVPLHNFKGVNEQILHSCWKEEKDVISYDGFPSLVGEVFYWGDEIEESAQILFKQRIQAKQCELVSVEEAKPLYDEVIVRKQGLQEYAEACIVKRILSIERFLLDKDREIFVSLQGIMDGYATAQ